MTSQPAIGVESFLQVSVDSLARLSGVVAEPPLDQPPDVQAALLNAQLGILQRQPKSQQAVIDYEFAAKYMPVLVEKFKLEHDIMEGPSILLNRVSYTPYYVRYLKTPDAGEITSNFASRIARLTDDDASGLPRDRVAEIGQFFATLLVLQGQSGISVDTKKAVIDRFKSWGRQWRGTFAQDTSDRCLVVLDDSSGFGPMLDDVKRKLEAPLKQCGGANCSKSQDNATLLQCSRCKTAVYCNTTHQKEAWPAHKRTCFVPTF
ncbi:hypothetical protein BKA70DRAFT_1272516 [Coprinopsis sp. MPI-PUGE-AT-0042]|nr:hypothetical protein BKA70DRAFT_1272516 [Coprinopsis sp. MPI-PUGE-AT-0042]